MDFAGKKILVVGGSGALGSTFVRLLSAKGATVYATCSKQSSAGAIPAESSLNLLADLADTQSVATLVNYLNLNIQLDGIVLAAGLVGFGNSQQTSVEATETLTRVNFLGQAQLLSGLAPLLAKGTEPFVAALTGVVAEKVFPGMHAYTASKTAMSAWLSSFSLEVKRDGIKVLDARPGHTETGLASRAIFGSAPNFAPGMTTEHVAEVVCDAILSGTFVLSGEDF